MIVALVAAGILGVAGGALTAVSIKIHKREARAAQAELARYQAETAGKVADATTAGIAAGEKAGAADVNAASANAESARANERAATLEKEAAAANERTAEVMKASAWRQLTPIQARTLETELAKRPGKARLAWIANDPESLGLATQFSQILAAAHWTIVGSANTYSSGLFWGIQIPNVPNDTDTTLFLRSALNTAQLHFFANDIPQPDMQMGGGGGDIALILIGSRRPTFTRAPD